MFDDEVMYAVLVYAVGMYTDDDTDSEVDDDDDEEDSSTGSYTGSLLRFKHRGTLLRPYYGLTTA